MAMTLKEALNHYSASGKDCPRAVFSELGDSIAVYLSEKAFISERIDDKLTVHRDLQSNELIGCTIKGISIIAKNAINIFNIEDDSIELKVLLYPNVPEDEPVKEFFYELAKQHIKVPIASQWRSAA